MASPSPTRLSTALKASNLQAILSTFSFVFSKNRISEALNPKNSKLHFLNKLVSTYFLLLCTGVEIFKMYGICLVNVAVVKHELTNRSYMLNLPDIHVASFIKIGHSFVLRCRFSLKIDSMF
jgi:hypothetical protein